MADEHFEPFQGIVPMVVFNTTDPLSLSKGTQGLEPCFEPEAFLLCYAVFIALWDLRKNVRMRRLGKCAETIYVPLGCYRAAFRIVLFERSWNHP